MNNKKTNKTPPIGSAVLRRHEKRNKEPGEAWGNEDGGSEGWVKKDCEGTGKDEV